MCRDLREEQDEKDRDSLIELVLAFDEIPRIIVKDKHTAFFPENVRENKKFTPIPNQNF